MPSRANALNSEGIVGMDTIDVDICIVTTIHGDFDNRIYQRQLSALVDGGWSVCMVAPWDFEKRNRHDFVFIRTPSPGSRLSRIRHGFRTFRAAKGVDAKLYIFHDPDFILFAALLKLLTGQPVIYDCHEDIPLNILHGKDWIPEVIRRPVSWLFWKLEDAVARYLGNVISAVVYMVERFRKTGAASVLVRNFPNFVVPGDFATERAVLFTGSISRNYGASNLLGIAREIKRRGLEIRLRIVDRFFMGRKLRQVFVDAIASEKLDVEILPPVFAHEMPELLAKGCIGLMVSLNVDNKVRGYPTKIFEYLAFGLAVVATDLISSREILQDGHLGILVEDQNYGAWVDAIERLYFNEDERLALVEAGKIAFETMYNWDMEKEKLLNFVESCIEQRP